MTEATRVKIEQYLAGALPPTELETFLLELRSDPAALAYLGRVLRQEALLFHLQRSAAPLPQPRRGWGWRAGTAVFRRFAVAASILLLLAVGGWFAWRSLTGPATQATLTEIRGDVYLDHGAEQPRERAQVGQKLAAGTRLATPGPTSGLVLALADGSRLEALADVALQLGGDTSEKRIVLDQGVVIVAAVRQPSGHALILETAQAETKVLGTRFRLTGGGEATRLEVEEGTVECRRKADGATIQVAERQQTLVRADIPLTARPVRVRSDLLLLYVCDRADEFLRDRSGVGVAADLRVGKANWKPSGLTFSVPAKVDTGSFPAKVRDAAARSGEATLEAWVGWELGEAALWHHLVATRSAIGQVQLFVDGVPLAPDRTPQDLLGAANAFLQELRRHQTAAGAKEVTLRLLAIYGRALSPGEVQQNQKAAVD